MTWFGFLAWDDDHNVLANPWVIDGSWWHFWTKPYYGLYVPIPYTVWTALALVTHEPWLFHLTNLLIHGVNAGLVSLLMARRGATRTVSLIGGLVFALHPVQVEAVAWVSGLRDLLCCFFALLALLCYERRLLPAFVAFAASLLCKPSAAALPLALLLLDRRWLRVVPFAALGLASAVWTSWIQTESLDPGTAATSVGERLQVGLDALGFYATKLAGPWGLAADYGRIPRTVLETGGWLLPVAGLVSLAGIGVALRKERRWPAVALALLAPTLGIVPFAFQRVSTVADRYLYLPMIGVACAAAPLLRRRWLAVPLLAVYGVLTVRQATTWMDDETFFHAMLAGNPRSFSAHGGLGNLELAAGRVPEALAHYEAALAEQPGNVLALANVGLALDRLGRYDEVMARIAPHAPLDDLAERSPLSAGGIARLDQVVGYAAAQTGQLKAALFLYCRAARASPEDPDAKAGLASLKAQTGAGCPDYKGDSNDGR